jgi:glycosyltransferase involved in cell wall biosynthesis
MEGTPVAVLEGMAAGLPIVSTRHGGIIDVLSNTTAGILLEEYDVRGTAAAMLEYAHDATRARRDGLEGRRLLQASWSMERSLAALSRVIDLASSGDHAGLAAMATA